MQVFHGRGPGTLRALSKVNSINEHKRLDHLENDDKKKVDHANNKLLPAHQGKVWKAMAKRGLNVSTSHHTLQSGR